MPRRTRATGAKYGGCGATRAGDVQSKPPRRAHTQSASNRFRGEFIFICAHVTPETTPTFPQSKKDVVAIFNTVLRRQIGTRNPTVEYICTRPELLFMLLHGYVKRKARCVLGGSVQLFIRTTSHASYTVTNGPRSRSAAATWCASVFASSRWPRSFSTRTISTNSFNTSRAPPLTLRRMPLRHSKYGCIK